MRRDDCGVWEEIQVLAGSMTGSRPGRRSGSMARIAGRTGGNETGMRSREGACRVKFW